jgi:hypothetical protein
MPYELRCAAAVCPVLGLEPVREWSALLSRFPIGESISPLNTPAEKPGLVGRRVGSAGVHSSQIFRRSLVATDFSALKSLVLPVSL